MVKIALVSCGTEYSGIQKEIEKAALKFGAEIILPEIDLDYINAVSYTHLTLPTMAVV